MSGYTPSPDAIRYVVNELRDPAWKNLAQGSGPGFVVWYEHGAEMMNWLNAKYGLDFKTPFDECGEIADKLERAVTEAGKESAS